MSKGKFTDGYFAFPIKIYDASSLKRIEDMEEANIEIPMEGDWIAGMARIPYKDMQTAIWNDGYSHGRTVVEVRDEGFDLTIVYIERYGECTCTWPRKKFEEKLNDFMAKQEVKEQEETCSQM